jgi:hypothetical protein
MKRAQLIAAALVASVATLALVACEEGGTEYRVTVPFETNYTEEDITEVTDYLRGFDDDLEFLVQESFPPTGVATLRTDEPDFCSQVTAELGSKPYVRDVTCDEAPGPAEAPDEPVSNEPTPGG